MAPDILGLGPPPSKKRRVSPPEGEACAAGYVDSSSRTPSSQTQLPRRRKLPPIARQVVPPEAASLLPSSVIDPLLEQSIALILKSYGFEGASAVALNHLRRRAGEFLHDVATNAMSYCAIQRRTRPTITDVQETLVNTLYSPAELEDEILRYRKSQTNPPPHLSDDGTPCQTPNGIAKPVKPHIFRLSSPDPATSAEISLVELLGPELLKPRRRYKAPIPHRPAYMAKLEQEHPGNPTFASQTKPVITVQTERNYIDPHQPMWPGRHTYEHHEETREIVRDAKKIRELASEEARQSGEMLRKLLAEYSKVSTATRNRGENNGGTTRKTGTEVYKGGNARQKRDEVFEKTWMSLIKGMEAEKDKAKAEREEKKRQKKEKREQAKNGVNGIFGTSMMEIDFDNESSEEDEPEEAEKETQIDDKGLLDTAVNCEKAFFAKGGLRRVMIQ